jgi:hypothetical protein
LHCEVVLQPHGLNITKFLRQKFGKKGFAKAPAARAVCHQDHRTSFGLFLGDGEFGKVGKVLLKPLKAIMASLRTLFLGVYASNPVIRVLFLPVCYVLLLSPFLTLAGYYLGFGRTLKAYVPEDLSWTDLLPQIALSTVFVLLPTRLLSGSGGASKSKNGGKRRVQALPYWIPGFRHFWSIVSGGDRWTKSVR